MRSPDAGARPAAPPIQGEEARPPGVLYGEGPAAFRLDLMRLAVLVVLAALIWCTLYNRWTVESWQTPLTYLADREKGDVIGCLALCKAVSEGHVLPLTFTTIPELGAPYAANWDDFPTPEKPLFCATGLLVRCVGLFPSANFAVLFGQVLAAVSFYAACRLLRCAWHWSFAAALVFAFSRYAFAHGLHHLAVAYCWHVPLCLVVAIWMLRGEGMETGTARFRFALIVAVITAVQNVYYTNMFVQLVLIGGLLQGWRRGWLAVLPAVWITLTTAAAFVLMNANTMAYGLVYGSNGGAVVRDYHWLEVFGLKLVDLVVPPPDHPFPPFAAWGAAHLKEVLLSPSEIPPAGYLGALGLAAMAWLVIESLRRLAARERLPLEAWIVLWIVLYAGVGGLNGIAGVLGAQLFRTATRYSIFILALVLIYAVRRLSAVAWGRTAWAYGAAALLAWFALWEQTPPMVSAKDVEDIALQVRSDRDFTARMEQALPAQAMVFQIPVMDFPESPGMNIGSYDHFRPYLYSSQLRYSFGSDKGRPHDKWQHDLAQVPFSEAVARLERCGFSALYINVNDFADKGARLIQTLHDMGRAVSFTNDKGDLLFVLLKPAAQPVFPEGL